MNNILTHTHSGLRWVALLLLVWAIFNAFTSKEFLKKHRLINLFAMVVLHVQLLIGLVQYFVTSEKVNFISGWMKDHTLRFYGMEHLLGMILGIALVTIGYVRSKKGNSPQEIYKPIKWSYLIGLIIIIASIPWPFRNLGAGWF